MCWVHSPIKGMLVEIFVGKHSHSSSSRFSLSSPTVRVGSRSTQLHKLPFMIKNFYNYLCKNMGKMFILGLALGIILPGVLSSKQSTGITSTTIIHSCNKTAETHRYFNISPEHKQTTQQQIEQLTQYQKNNCTKILQSTLFPEDRIQFRSNGFVSTVMDAYSRHHNLVIRPDDVWAAIMTQFSFYVNKNAEEFRGKFVNFEGKKTLEVKLNGRLETVSYAEMVKLMSGKIDENLVDSQVKGWALPNFSTTTDNDVVSTGVVFMATFKKYFTYRVSIACGIPYIYLEGTEQDWQNVYDRLGKLKEYKLEKWYNMLEPIVKQFVEAKKGNVDIDFWQKIVNHRAGSGVSYISGWITAFCVFDGEGNEYQEKPRYANVPNRGEWLVVDTSDIPSGTVEVDVDIDDNGKEYKSVMFGGHMATTITGETGNAVQPTLGWVIALK